MNSFTKYFSACSIKGGGLYLQRKKVEIEDMIKIYKIMKAMLSHLLNSDILELRALSET